MKQLLNFLLPCLIYFSCNQNYLPGYNYDLFKDTKAAELAESVMEGDMVSVENILATDPALVNFQEPKFGHTLLMVAIANNQHDRAIKLLELGASVRIRSFSDSADALMVLSWGYNGNTCDTVMLSQLIKYGCDCSTYAFSRPDTRVHVINKSIGSNMCLDYIKILTNCGSSLNERLNGREMDSPLVDAIMLRRWDVANYLMDTPGFAPPEYCLIREKKGIKDTILASEFIQEQQLKGLRVSDTSTVNALLLKIKWFENDTNRVRQLRSY